MLKYVTTTLSVLQSPFSGFVLQLDSPLLYLFAFRPITALMLKLPLI